VSFHSDKALYGHMRLHSVKSVLNVKNEFCSNSNQTLSRPRPSYHPLKWKITGKRGRKRRHPFDPRDKEVMECAEVFLSERSQIGTQNTHEDSINLNFGSEKPETRLQIGGNYGTVAASNMQEVKSFTDQAAP